MAPLEKTLAFLLRRLEADGKLSLSLYSAAISARDGSPVLAAGLGYHQNPRCLEIKAVGERHRRCVHYKNTKICRAFETGEVFFDLCPFGVLDAVVPIPAKHPRFVLFISDARRFHGRRRGDMALRPVDPDPLAPAPQFREQIPQIRALVEAVLAQHRGEWTSPGGDSLLGQKVALARHNVAFHFASPVSLAALSQQLHVPKALLARYYKKTWGKTLHQDLNEHRVAHARGLLEGGATVIEAAHECGYNDAGYFCRIFHRLIGMSPRVWKEKKGKQGKGRASRSAGEAGPR